MVFGPLVPVAVGVVGLVAMYRQAADGPLGVTE